MRGSRSPENNAPSKRDSDRGRDLPTLRFDLARRRWRGTSIDPVAIASTFIVLGAIAFVPMAHVATWERVSIGLIFLAIVVIYELRRRSKERGSRERIDATREGIVRKRGGELPTMLVRWSERFGVTILANRARDRALFAFTAPNATRYVRVDLDGAPLAVARSLLSRATLALDADVLLGAHDDDAPSLRAPDALRLVNAIEERAPASFDRLYLSDAQGAAIALDENVLRVGARSVDLRAPLEWRGFMFHESSAQMMTIYQATSVKQSGTEIVLVATMASELYLALADAHPPETDLARDVAMRRALARDLRLTQATAESPPPRELRVAIDRMFVLPLRIALNRAPRAARISTPPPRTEPAGRTP